MRRIFDIRTTTSSAPFWMKTVAGGLSACVFGMTLVWPRWIETVFGLDPDGGSGETEWGITVALFVFAVLMFMATRRQWKRVAMASSLE